MMDAPASLGSPVRRLLIACSIGEALTGLALVVHPPLVVGLLFGAEVSAAGVTVSRVAGIALSSLGCACWPSRGRAHAAAATGMLLYSLATALYLLIVGVSSETRGVLLWPAVGLHVAVALLLAWAWSRSARTPTGPGS